MSLILSVVCQSLAYGHLNKPQFSRLPNLKWLQVQGSVIEDSWFQDEPSLLNQLRELSVGYTCINSATFAAIKRHGHNLKNICLCYADLQDRDLKFDNSGFPELKTICLRDCIDVTCEGVFSLIQSCPSLQNVYLDEDLAESFAVHHSVDNNRYMSRTVKKIFCNHEEEVERYFESCFSK